MTINPIHQINEHANVILIKNLRGTSNKNVLGERGSDDKTLVNLCILMCLKDKRLPQ